MKTAKILVHHVFGTKGTTFAGVFYRGKRLWYRMENENAPAMLEKAKEYAFSQGFTHVRVEY